MFISKEEWKEKFTTELVQDLVNRISAIEKHKEGSSFDTVAALDPTLAEAFSLLKPTYEKYVEFSLLLLQDQKTFEQIYEMAIAIAMLDKHKLINRAYTVFLHKEIDPRRWDSITSIGETFDIDYLDKEKAEIVILFQRTDPEFQHLLAPIIKEKHANENKDKTVGEVKEQSAGCSV
jgi:hypothetical protein